MASPSVLLLDDGELDDVHLLLEQLGVACARVRGGAIVDGTPPPRHLLIATPRRIDAVAETLDGSGEVPIRVMVSQEDSNTLRDRLRRDGFDFLVRRPVHPEALRLLLLHCIYRGEERRRDRRVPVGREVSYRCGFSTRRGTLVELSSGGCRLLAQRPLETGKRVRVSIPAAAEGDPEATLRGRVSRVERQERGDGEHFALGIEFEALEPQQEKALETLLVTCAQGPATLAAAGAGLPVPEPQPVPESAPAASPPSRMRRRLRGIVREINAAQPVEEAGSEPAASTAGADPESEAAAAPPAGPASERRTNRRGQYEHKIPAFGNRALRVLVGRDLSVGGMRIDRTDGLEIGDRLHLAIYGEPGREPLLLWGAIARDDGPSGMALVFEAMPAEAEAQLERMVYDLPCVESLHDTEVEAMGTVLAEIVG